jgi:hypothetical protein
LGQSRSTTAPPSSSRPRGAIRCGGSISNQAPRNRHAFSKKIDNHVHALALFFCHYNFCRQHKSLKGISPAMAAGVTETLWSMEMIAERIEANRPQPGKRGPYKKRAS